MKSRSSFSFLAALGCVLGCSDTLAQRLENITATAQGNQIVVEYVLASTNTRDRYEVLLYSSHNSYASPLRLVQGDIGQNVYPGSKKVIWQARQELLSYEGKLSFEVRGKLIAGALVVSGPGSARRGKTASITWNGGLKNESVKIELLDANGKHLEHISSPANTGSFTWSLPVEMEKGNYKIEIAQGGDKVTGPLFPVQSKIPLALKVAPIVLIGGAVIFAGGGGGSKEDPPRDEELPAPPDGN